MDFYEFKEVPAKWISKLVGKERFQKFLFAVFGRLLWVPVGASVVAVDQQERYCLLERDGSFEFPGGVIHYGETPSEAAVREFKEETGFDVELERLEKAVMTGAGSIGILYSGDILGGHKKSTWEGETVLVEREELKEKLDEDAYAEVEDML